MTSILKLSTLFFAIRRPMIIQRPFTTTYTLYKGKEVIEKSKFESKFIKKIETKEDQKEKEKTFKKRKIYQDNDDLFWENENKTFYRVFGNWKCKNKTCRNKWSSAYTWILLEKWKNGVPISDLTESDFSQQACKKCNSKTNQVINCSNLKSNDDIDKVVPHVSELCAKCRKGYPCTDY